MEKPLREHSSTSGGRYVETTNGKQLVTDIRMLGCPDELATRIEKRNSERNGQVPASDLKNRLDALKNTISAN